MIRKIYVVYNFVCGVLIALALLDKYMGRILKILDPAFKNLLNSKLSADKATAKEQIIHVLKKSSNDGIIKTI